MQYEFLFFKKQEDDSRNLEALKIVHYLFIHTQFYSNHSALFTCILHYLAQQS